MAKRHAPRRGSRAFYPRKRAKRIYPRVNSYPETSEVCVQAFPVYKAGMTQLITINEDEKSPKFKQEEAIPVTILEAPAVKVYGIRAYKAYPEGLKAFTEVYAEKLDKRLARKITLPKEYSAEDRIKAIESNLDDIAEIRLLVHTQPPFKKTPEILELTVFGPIKEAWEYAKQKLGQELEAKEVFQEGKMVDAIAVTKGKGTQGPVKRFGIRIQIRKNKWHRRNPGSLGAFSVARTFWTVPMSGQMGFQTRTEYNKFLLKMGENGEEATPKGGLVHYGVVRGPYILVKGSVPGPKKRLVVLRNAIRPYEMKMPTIKEVVTTPQQ